MKLKGILVIALLAISITGFSQRWKLKRYEVVFGIGSTNIYGDIGGTAAADNLYGLKDIRINETRYSIYGGIRYKLQQDVAVKLNLIYGKGISSDLKSRNETRGYSFQTSLFEPSIQFEYYFLSEEKRNSFSGLFSRKGMINNFAILSAYGFAGAGGVFFSPEINLNGKSPVTGEIINGYGTSSLVLPVGLGLKYAIDKNWSLGFEFGRRVTFSDYIDGISTRWSKANDTYYFGIFQAIYKLNTNRQGVPQFLAGRRTSRR